MADLKAPRIKWLIEPTFDDDGVQRTAGIDQFGREHGDPVPLRPPVGLSVDQGDELQTAIRNLFTRERARFMAAIQAEQFETEEEANDFLTEDEVFPPGNEPWEDIHEFPAEPAGDGRAEAAASQRPPNGQNRAAEHATGHPADQIVSGGSASASPSSATTEQKQIGEVERSSGTVVPPTLGVRDQSGTGR